jgi:hypothetical protein
MQAALESGPAGIPQIPAAIPAPASGCRRQAAIPRTRWDFSDANSSSMWTRWKKETFDQRWVFERQWMRNIWYILNRQWIYFDSKRGQWQDKRLAKWIPRPVTNFLKDGVQSVPRELRAINYGANARPMDDDILSITTASVADDYAPLLHEDHNMDSVMNESDFWQLACGNAILHENVVYDIKNGTVDVGMNVCADCGQESDDVAVVAPSRNARSASRRISSRRSIR